MTIKIKNNTDNQHFINLNDLISAISYLDFSNRKERKIALKPLRSLRHIFASACRQTGLKTFFGHIRNS